MFLVFLLEMKKKNSKSHNQKIHDAHLQRIQEKEAAKQVIDYFQ